MDFLEVGMGLLAGYFPFLFVEFFLFCYILLSKVLFEECEVSGLDEIEHFIVYNLFDL